MKKTRYNCGKNNGEERILFQYYNKLSIEINPNSSISKKQFLA